MRSMNKQSRKGKWIEITIERDQIKEDEKIINRPRHYYNGSWHYPDLRYYDGLCDLTDAEIRIVRLDDEAQTFIETAYTTDIAVIPEWIDYINRDHRRRQSPLLVSISYYTTVARPSWRSKAPPRFKNPIQAISLCVGGSHCLIFELRDVNVEVERSEMLRDIVPLRRFLEDRRIAVVGIGMEKFAKQAREELGIDVVDPMELRSLIEEAFGDQKLRGRGDLQEVEEMAEMVLDGMKNVREKEKKVKDMDWGYEEVTEDALMYATRDAYFAFEIGKKCLDLIGRKS